MAIHILMEKVEETETNVSYRFGFEHPLNGIVQLDRTTGETTVIQGSRFSGDRAAWVLRMCWERGDFPDETDYRT